MHMSWLNAACSLKLGKFLRNFWDKCLTIVSLVRSLAQFFKFLMYNIAQHAVSVILTPVQAIDDPDFFSVTGLLPQRVVVCQNCHDNWYFLCNWIEQVTLWKHMHAFWCKPIRRWLFFWRTLFCLPLTLEPEPKYWTN